MKNKKLIIILCLFCMFVVSLVYGDVIPDRLWFSYSERTPKGEAVNDDFELATGFENDSYIAKYLSERENDGNYVGYRLWVEWYKWLESDILVKEAYDLSSQSLRALWQPYPEAGFFDRFKIGGVSNMQNWQSHTVMLSLTYKSDRHMLSYETNFYNRCMVMVKMGWDFPIKKNFSIEPYFEYQDINGQSNYQNKVLFVVKI